MKEECEKEENNNREERQQQWRGEWQSTKQEEKQKQLHIYNKIYLLWCLRRCSQLHRTNVFIFILIIDVEICYTIPTTWSAWGWSVLLSHWRKEDHIIFILIVSHPMDSTWSARLLCHGREEGFYIFITSSCGCFLCGREVCFLFFFKAFGYPIPSTVSLERFVLFLCMISSCGGSSRGKRLQRLGGERLNSLGRKRGIRRKRW